MDAFGEHATVLMTIATGGSASMAGSFPTDCMRVSTCRMKSTPKNRNGAGGMETIRPNGTETTPAGTEKTTWE